MMDRIERCDKLNTPLTILRSLLSNANCAITSVGRSNSWMISGRDRLPSRRRTASAVLSRKGT